jgi:hypothetical protein
MTSVKTHHIIVSPDTVYPANTVVRDMPQTLIDEMLPLKALSVIEEKAPLPVVKRRRTRFKHNG